MTRQGWIRHCIAALLLLGSASAGRETPFAVIVHPSNRFMSLNRSKIGFLYLRKISRWPWGAEAEPIDLSDRGARSEFAREVLRTTVEQLDAYWMDRRQTRGVMPPKEVAGAAAAKAFVAAHPGAIAYIPRRDVDSTVKVLEVEP